MDWTEYRGAIQGRGSNNNGVLGGGKLGRRGCNGYRAGDSIKDACGEETAGQVVETSLFCFLASEEGEQQQGGWWQEGKQVLKGIWQGQ